MSPAIPDVITVVGSAYFQPIADLVDKLLKRPLPPAFPAGSGDHENGYSASLVVLLVAVLESYASRLRFVRSEDVVAGAVAHLIFWLNTSRPFPQRTTCSRSSSRGTR